MRLSKVILAGLLASSVAAPGALAQSNIGVTGSVVNSVRSTVGDSTKDLKVGDQVVQNEKIETAARSRTQILLLDESTLTIGPSAVFVLDELVFDPGAQKQSVAITLTEGVFRFVSGNLPHDAYILTTPTAVIGVRGTVFDIIVEAVTGVTTVILREGALLIQSIGGASLALDVPGLSTIIGAGGAPPTPPAPPSEAAQAAVGTLTAPARELQEATIDPSVTDAGGSPIRVETIREATSENESSSSESSGP